MTPDLWLPLGALFISIALITGAAASLVLARNTPERRRLRQLAPEGGPSLVEKVRLTEQLDPRLVRMTRMMPKSPKELSRLRRRLGAAGIRSFGAAVFYSLAEIMLPFLFAIVPLKLLLPPMAWIMAAIAAMIGYMIPGLVLARLITLQKRRIENGLPDALDLMIVCVEAGCGLDQAIVKTSTELEISHPDLAHELELVTTEVRAGKPRIEAFKNFAARTRVDDVRSLVAMLVQTDRFGTSIAQALRVQADTLRSQRQAAAEETAAKASVKMSFPLVLFIFPATFLILAGPTVIGLMNSPFFKDQ